MSDLDKAIRDRLQVVRVHMGEHRNAQFDDGVDPLFNDAGELGAAVVAVLDLHVPIDVHDMDAGGEPPPVVERSCRDCSDKDYVQALECGERVAWGDGVDWPCATVTAIATCLGVSGEDRSEPTPTPREPRVWRHRGSGYDPAPGGGVRVRDCHGDIWTPRDRGPGDRVWETPDTAPFRWDYVLKKWGPLTEVVTPEGTP